MPPAPGRGSANTISQLRFRFKPARKFQVPFLGVTARLIMPLGRDVVLCCVQTGQGENPCSGHFQDQYKLLAGGRFAEIRLLDPPDCCAEKRLTLAPSAAGDRNESPRR